MVEQFPKTITKLYMSTEGQVFSRAIYNTECHSKMI